ncbi:hypothetical protein EV356DRAFT_537570 [Viridothelium virens]|uniref:Nucleoside 2-deoxyribosyltransferase n=1 Tax=Viridothelium virens TaxID=1048519 RepID=A0A6A6GTQ9_VIRVR|nr:hypothetical protein EV356DRAFT_537570 [Viridothelium virens]
MTIPIFLYHPPPIDQSQHLFIRVLRDHLRLRGFLPRIIDAYDVHPQSSGGSFNTARLEAIRRLLTETDGVICVAFRQTYIANGIKFAPHADYYSEIPVSREWLASPWVHVVNAMAWQAGLPLLVLRDSDVIEQGPLEGGPGILGLWMTIDFGSDGELLAQDLVESPQWSTVGGQWEQQCRNVAKRKGEPRRLYEKV